MPMCRHRGMHTTNTDPGADMPRSQIPVSMIMCELRCLHIHGPELITGGQHVCPSRADHVRRTFQHLYNQLTNAAASQGCTCPHTHVYIYIYIYIDAHRLFGIVRDPWSPGTANRRSWENVVPDPPGSLTKHCALANQRCISP